MFLRSNPDCMIHLLNITLINGRFSILGLNNFKWLHALIFEGFINTGRVGVALHKYCRRSESNRHGVEAPRDFESLSGTHVFISH